MRDPRDAVEGVAVDARYLFGDGEFAADTRDILGNAQDSTRHSHENAVHRSKGLAALRNGNGEAVERVVADAGDRSGNLDFRQTRIVEGIRTDTRQTFGQFERGKPLHAVEHARADGLQSCRQDHLRDGAASLEHILCKLGKRLRQKRFALVAGRRLIRRIVQLDGCERRAAEEVAVGQIGDLAVENDLGQSRVVFKYIRCIVRSRVVTDGRRQVLHFFERCAVAERTVADLCNGFGNDDLFDRGVVERVVADQR